MLYASVTNDVAAVGYARTVWAVTVKSYRIAAAWNLRNQLWWWLQLRNATEDVKHPHIIQIHQ